MSDPLPPSPAPILQSALPRLPWMEPAMARLPGILPLKDEGWITRDDAFAAQMARRDLLIGEHPAAVHALLPAAEEPAQELYDMILGELSKDPAYQITPEAVVRPDGVRVLQDRSQPLATLGRLVQEDLCILQDGPDGSHLLNGAVLCFPASWMLAQKVGRSMLRIHVPVTEYDDRVARGVQRLFDAIRPEQPLWRMNFLTYDDPELHQPRPEGDLRPQPAEHRYVRCEKQVLLRLPKTQAVAFSIHTYQVESATIPVEAFTALRSRQH